MRKLKLFAVGVMLVAALAGCGANKTSETNEKTEVTIGYFDNITHAQALLMEHDGTLEKSFSESILQTLKKPFALV